MMDGEVNGGDCDYLLFPNNKTLLGQYLLSLDKMLKSKKNCIEEDLSGVLDKYQESLKDSDIFLSHGIVNINFAEAALFLQNASTLYGKKVDMLWTNTLDCQKRMIEFESEQRKKKEAAERAEKKKKEIAKAPKTKAPAEESKKEDAFWKSIDKFKNAIQEKTGEIQRMHNLNNVRTEKWAKVNQQRTQSSLTVDLRDYNVSQPHFLPDIEVMGEDNELLTKLDELNMCILTNTMSSDEVHFKVKFLSQNVNEVDYYYKTDDFLANHHKETHMKPSELETSCLSDYNDFEENCQADKNSSRAERILKIKRNSSRISDAISSVDSAFHERSFLSDSYPASIASRRKSDSLFGDGTSREDDVCEEAIDLMDNLVVQCSFDDGSDNAVICTPERNSTCNDENIEKSNLEKVLLAEFPSPKHTSKEFIARKRKSVIMDEEFVNKRTRIVDQEIRILKRSQKINFAKLLKIKTIAKFSEFEEFYFLNYEKGEDESGIEYDFDTDADAGSVFEELVSEDDSLTCFSNIEIQSSEIAGATLNTNNKVLFDHTYCATIATEIDQIIENQTQNFNLCETTLPSVELNPQDILSERQNNSFTDVQNWQKFITDKLKNIEQKSDFDIHNYSTVILDALPSQKTKRFTDIVCGMKASEVSKYFLATLSLACTYNVDILNVQQGELANDEMELKLLSKARHHEELEHYQAPSEESFQEKMHKVRMFTKKGKKRTKLC